MARRLLVVDGAALFSAHGYRGEVGHLVYLPGGRPCNCGLAGCVEAYAGMTTIRKRYSELGRTAPSALQVLADTTSDLERLERSGGSVREALR